MSTISRPFIKGHENRKLPLPTRFSLWCWTKTQHLFRNEPNTNTQNPIRVVCISDSHNKQFTIPSGDLLLHAGDLSVYGTFKEIQNQLDWINAQTHLHKVVIAGNHDLLLDENFCRKFPDRELDQRKGERASDLNWGNIIYLRNTSVSLNFASGRSLTIWGSPWTPAHGNFAFQYPLSDADQYYSVSSASMKVDEAFKADIILTHGPPKYHLDGRSAGCPRLLRLLWGMAEHPPKLIVFGHIHESKGVEFLQWDALQSAFEGAMQSPTSYFKMMTLVFRLFVLYLGFLMGYKDMSRTRLVNASMTIGPRHELQDDPIVVLL